MGMQELGHARSNPSLASYQNRIGCHSSGAGEFCIRNSNHPDHAAVENAAMDHIEYRATVIATTPSAQARFQARRSSRSGRERSRSGCLTQPRLSSN